MVNRTGCRPVVATTGLGSPGFESRQGAESCRVAKLKFETEKNPSSCMYLKRNQLQTIFFRHRHQQMDGCFVTRSCHKMSKCFGPNSFAKVSKAAKQQLNPFVFHCLRYILKRGFSRRIFSPTV
jgi:hypothetical protein